MSNPLIHRNRIICYNDTTSDILATRKVNTAKPILSQPGNYLAAIESATVDLSRAVLDYAPRYKVAIWYDLKDDVLPYGLNVFSFDKELRFVDEFLKWLSDITQKAALPYNLGLFELNSDELFTYSIPTAAKTEAFDSDIFRVYFNEPLCKILEGFYQPDDPEEFQNELFYKMKPTNHTAITDTLYRLNKIESILFETTLKITPTEILDIKQNILESRPIFGSVELNNLQFSLTQKGDWRYIPSLLRYYNLVPEERITSYAVSVHLCYNNGEIRQHILGPSERFLVNLVFMPQGVDL